MRAPVLDVQFLAEDQLLVCGANRQVQMYNLATDTMTTLGTHDAPVATARFLPEFGVVVSSSYDSTMRWWDPRAPATPRHVLRLASRPFCMDARRDLIVSCQAPVTRPTATGGAAMASPVELYSMRNLAAPERRLDSPLRMQTRCVRVFPNTTAFVLASVEGRCTVRLRDGTYTVLAAVARWHSLLTPRKPTGARSNGRPGGNRRVLVQMPS